MTVKAGLRKGSAFPQTRWQVNVTASKAKQSVIYVEFFSQSSNYQINLSKFNAVTGFEITLQMKGTLKVSTISLVYHT
jgi:hypothetical protein